jgi:hypothetical protein
MQRHLLLLAIAACNASSDAAPDASSPPPEIDAAVTPTWEADVRLTNDAAASTTTFNFARDIALTSDGSVHVAWFDTRDGREQIYVARSKDGGTTWDTATKIAPSANQQLHASIAASGSNVYVAWHEIRNGMYYVVVDRSEDNGATWKAPITLTTTGKSAHPSIAADGDTLHVVYNDTNTYTEIWYARSSDRGATFNTPTQLSPASSESWVGGVNVSGARVVASWVDYKDANEEEYLRISDDGGATWSTTTRMTNDAADSWAPSVAISGDTIHFAWFDRRDSQYTDTDVETYLDGIGTLVGLSLPAAPARTPDHYYLYDFLTRLQTKVTAIQQAAQPYVMNGGDPNVLMARFTEYQKRFATWAMSWEVYYKRSTDGGKTWSTDKRITNAQYLSQRPSIVAIGDRVDMVWFDGRDGTGMGDDETEIYATHSLDGGATWSTDERLTNAAGKSMFVSMAATEDRLHVVWLDARDGNDEIYYKRETR